MSYYWQIIMVILFLLVILFFLIVVPYLRSLNFYLNPSIVQTIYSNVFMDSKWDFSVNHISPINAESEKVDWDSDDDNSYEFVTPYLYGLRVENDKEKGFTGYTESGSSIVKPNVEVKIVLFGSLFDEVDSIGFTDNDDCLKALHVLKADFKDQTENMIVLKYKFKSTKECFKVCIKQTPARNGYFLESTLPFNISRTFISTADIPEKKNNDSRIVQYVLPFFTCVVILFILLDFPVSKKEKNIQKNDEIMSNQKYSDVVLISSDQIEVPSHRCILAKYSKIFEKIIDEASELPVTINVENYNAEIIEAALNLLYDKRDAINGKEMEIFKFALHYDIKDIMNSMYSFFEKFVNSTNVCEYIQIAYDHDLDELKETCIIILAENKEKIDISTLKALPKDIYFDIFIKYFHFD